MNNKIEILSPIKLKIDKIENADGLSKKEINSAIKNKLPKITFNKKRYFTYKTSKNTLVISHFDTDYEPIKLKRNKIIPIFSLLKKGLSQDSIDKNSYTVIVVSGNVKIICLYKGDELIDYEYSKNGVEQLLKKMFKEHGIDKNKKNYEILTNDSSISLSYIKTKQLDMEEIYKKLKKEDFLFIQSQLSNKIKNVINKIKMGIIPTIITVGGIRILSFQYMQLENLNGNINNLKEQNKKLKTIREASVMKINKLETNINDSIDKKSTVLETKIGELNSSFIKLGDNDKEINMEEIINRMNNEGRENQKILIRMINSNTDTLNEAINSMNNNKHQPMQHNQPIQKEKVEEIINPDGTITKKIVVNKSLFEKIQDLNIKLVSVSDRFVSISISTITSLSKSTIIDLHKDLKTMINKDLSRTYNSKEEIVYIGNNENSLKYKIFKKSNQLLPIGE